jgi:hypothetical protein
MVDYNTTTKIATKIKPKTIAIVTVVELLMLYSPSWLFVSFRSPHINNYCRERAM